MPQSKRSRNGQRGQSVRRRPSLLTPSARPAERPATQSLGLLEAAAETHSVTGGSLSNTETVNVDGMSTFDATTVDTPDLNGADSITGHNLSTSRTANNDQTAPPEHAETTNRSEPVPPTAMPSGDETDARMDQIRKILETAAMPVLDKCALYAEWVKHAEANASVLGQVVSKPQGGRPKGAISRAAEELPIPAKNKKAREKFIRRAIDINCIWPEAKAAARAAGLANIHSALLAIAVEKPTPEAQLAKVKEIADQRAAPRKSRKVNKREAINSSNAPPTQDVAELPDLIETSKESWTAEEGLEFDALLETWLKEGVLRQAEWKKTSAITCHRFTRNVLLSTNDVEAETDQSQCLK
jgi:hypothetical protein